jgi:hypothetical protein
MGRTVFILGAGASVRAGCPVMSTFLDVADRLRNSRQLIHPYESAFKSVFEARAQLQSVHSKARLDVHNIESVFGAFEIARRFKKGFGKLKDEDVNGLSRSMRLLISSTLESTTRFGLGHEKLIPPHPYGLFADYLRKLKTKSGVAIITFNYDLGLDVALELSGTPIDYCLDTNLTGGPSIPVIKLHGSLNWGRCKSCGGMVVPWQMADFFRRFPLGSTSNNRPYQYSGDVVYIHVTSATSGHRHKCGTVLEDDSPVIVPPTWEKTNHDQGFENMWAHAASYLARAENIVVVGYSLPPSDQFFPMLYALGTVSDTVLKRFWVFDPDHDGSVKRRFEGMLGEAALQRFQRFDIPFQDCFPKLEELAADP